MVLSDPGRLISIHLVHTALTSGWCRIMLLYELIIIDFSDPVFNPQWCQSCYILPLSLRIDVISSISKWSLGLVPEVTFWGF